MKSTKILFLLFGLVTLLASCSKKSDDPQPALASASLSLSSGQAITVPSGLSSSTDIHAEEAYNYVTSVNAITSATSAFKAPAGAAKSSTPIVGVNVGGRTAATQQTYLVYTWTDTQSGASVAYQVSETTDSYTFELFFKDTGTTVWIRYLDAEEKKDKSSGFLKIYDPTITKVSPPTLSYTWTRGTNTINFVVTDDMGTKIVIDANTQTKVGEITYYVDNALSDKLTWDAQGHGTWKHYDTDGITVLSSGTW
jgi:hypothetical protein